MDKKYVLIGGIVVLVLIVGVMWQLGVFEGGPGDSQVYAACGRICIGGIPWRP